MNALPESVTALLEHAGDLVDLSSLRAAAETWSKAPWRVAVVGRTTVGKSTLINAMVGHKALRTGLGGVSATTAEGPDASGTVWLDTPGLDGSERDATGAALAGADAVVWVVDGLQPMTSTERDALASLPPGVPVHVVVSRRDQVEPAELGSVMERVRALAARWAPLTVRSADLRAAERHGASELADLGEPAPWLSPRRREALRRALLDLEEAVRALPPPPDREAIALALVGRWRGVVRGVVEPVEAAIRAGRLEHRAVASRWLHAAAIPAWEAFQADAVRAIAPLVPADLLVVELPAPATHGGVDIAGGLGGAGAALREVRAAAARWLLDGEVAVREWVSGAAADPAPAAARARLEGWLRDALGAVGRGVRPSPASC